ncbi:MAG TPA: hypothetical protein VJL29_04725 [Thermoguttaceae bacterium]|nr:hypothetical protein [Thermoguttaceae bacterium]
MFMHWKHRPMVWGVTGLLLGAVLAGFCPHAPLHATATDRYDTFAISTGFVDDSVEAIYFLDFLTGDLKAAVLSRQLPPRFSAFFERNILNDLGIGPSNNPRYLIVTGLNDLRRGGSRLRPSLGVCYVAEITTGRVAAYAIPWDLNRHASGQGQTGEIILLDVRQFRTAAVRP